MIGHGLEPGQSDDNTPTGKPNVRSGYTLTILRKNVDGAWVLARDANLLAPESGGSPAPQPS